MEKKLTLTIEDQVIKTAKKYAQIKGISLSRLIEDYLRTLSNEDKLANEITPRIARLRGSIKLPADFNYKKMIGESICQHL